jgi:hypothetical protein
MIGGIDRGVGREIGRGVLRGIGGRATAPASKGNQDVDDVRKIHCRSMAFRDQRHLVGCRQALFLESL